MADRIPARRGEAWAWWTWLISGTVGFLSFLSYLGYGYLDTWHGVGTLLILPVFVVGMGAEPTVDHRSGPTPAA